MAQKRKKGYKSHTLRDNSVPLQLNKMWRMNLDDNANK